MRSVKDAQVREGRALGSGQKQKETGEVQHTHGGEQEGQAPQERGKDYKDLI